MKKTVCLLLASFLLLIPFIRKSEPNASSPELESEVLGSWVTESTIDYVQSPTTNDETVSVDVRHSIEFHKDGTGKWTSSFNSYLPSIQREFNYTLFDNTIKFVFDDGTADEYVISCSSDTLCLDGRVDIQLGRSD